MTQKRILDQWGGVVSVIETDTAAKTTTIAEYQDTAPYIDRNKRLQTMNGGYSPSRDLRRVASIPNVIMLQLLRKAGIRPIDFFRRPKAYSKWLRGVIYDPDNRHLLTASHKSGNSQHVIVR